MPTIVRANTNATTIMIGEKAADLIRACPPSLHHSEQEPNGAHAMEWAAGIHAELSRS